LFPPYSFARLCFAIKSHKEIKPIKLIVKKTHSLVASSYGEYTALASEIDKSSINVSLDQVIAAAPSPVSFGRQRLWRCDGRNRRRSRSAFACLIWQATALALRRSKSASEPQRLRLFHLAGNGFGAATVEIGVGAAAPSPV
jgi:hypothetical protein